MRFLGTPSPFKYRPPQIVHCLGQTPFGRQLKQSHGFRVIVWHATAFVVQEAEVRHRLSDALLGSQAVPLGCLSVALRGCLKIR